MTMLTTSLHLLNITIYQANGVIPSCSPLYMVEGQVKYCRAPLSVVSFHSLIEIMVFLISNVYTVYENVDHIIGYIKHNFFYQTNGAFPLCSLLFMG